MILQHGIKCNLCGDEIYSEHRHDLVWCKCKACFVDGGRDYLRVGAMENSFTYISRDVTLQTVMREVNEDIDTWTLNELKQYAFDRLVDERMKEHEK